MKLQFKWKYIINSLFFVLVLIVSVGYFVTGDTASRYSSRVESADKSTMVSIAKWNFDAKIEDSVIGVDLLKTIVDNNFSSDKIVPGSKGVIPVVIDGTLSNVVISYSISIDTASSSLPSNFKLYSDANYQNEITSLDGDIPLESDSAFSTNLYWKWVFTDDDESEWQNKEIKLYLIANAEQKIDGDV